MQNNVIQTIINLPIFEAAWVLWVLIALSFISIGVILERFFFFNKRSCNLDALSTSLEQALEQHQEKTLETSLASEVSLENKVVASALKRLHMGAESVAEHIDGAIKRERALLETGLPFLATIGSNAPFIGLFGTVLGIIRAFRDLSGGNMAEASSSVMAGISEALVATAVGLVVAIPAVIAYNSFKTKVLKSVSNAQVLRSVILTHLKKTSSTKAV